MHRPIFTGLDVLIIGLVISVGWLALYALAGCAS